MEFVSDLVSKGTEHLRDNIQDCHDIDVLEKGIKYVHSIGAQAFITYTLNETCYVSSFSRLIAHLYDRYVQLLEDPYDYHPSLVGNQSLAEDVLQYCDINLAKSFIENKKDFDERWVRLVSDFNAQSPLLLEHHADKVHEVLMESELTTIIRLLCSMVFTKIKEDFWYSLFEPHKNDDLSQESLFSLMESCHINKFFRIYRLFFDHPLAMEYVKQNYMFRAVNYDNLIQYIPFLTEKCGIPMKEYETKMLELLEQGTCDETTLTLREWACRGFIQLEHLEYINATVIDMQWGVLQEALDSSKQKTEEVFRIPEDVLHKVVTFL